MATFTYESAGPKPTIIADPTTVGAFTTEVGTPVTATVNVTGENLTGGITATVSGTNADYFSTTMNGSELTITYNHGIRVVLEEEQHRSAAYDGDSMVGICEYIVTGDAWTIIHTRVLSEYGGKNIAKRLVFCVAENAERAKKKIASVCSYADHILELKK